MKTKREVELRAIMENNLNDNGDWFDNHNWDGLIECDELLTDKELDWMREHYDVSVVLVPKEA